MPLGTLLQERFTDNATLATIQLLQRLGVQVTSRTVADAVESHPDHPSLLSISDSLSRWRVESAALRIEPENLATLPVPFLAHQHGANGSFVVVTQVGETTVRSLDDAGRERERERAAFVREWSGVALLAESSAASGQRDHAQRRREERLARRRPGLILLLFLVLTAWFCTVSAGRDGIWPALLLSIKLIGGITSSLLLWFEIDRSSSALGRVCGGGRSFNCSAVLSSRRAMVFGVVSWSAVGFVYFAGGFLLLLTSAAVPAPAMAMLAWLNLLALPYAVFSVTYQWKIARAWCLPCLAVQALLVLELATTLARHGTSDGGPLHTPLVASTGWLLATACFVLPALFWALARPAFRAAHDVPRLREERNRMTRDRDVFGVLLRRQRRVTIPTTLGITLGDPGARHHIIEVYDPYCAPCARAHASLDVLLESGADVKVQIVLIAADEDRDRRTPPVRHLLALYATGDAPLARCALREWFAGRSGYDAFAARYPLGARPRQHDSELYAMAMWCKTMGITQTPTTFVDGHQLPSGYVLDDLTHLLARHAAGCGAEQLRWPRHDPRLKEHEHASVPGEDPFTAEVRAKSSRPANGEAPRQ